MESDMFSIKANRMSRDAWQYLGKAREIKYDIAIGNPRIDEAYSRETIAHYVRLARMTLGTAIIYRRMNGRV
jgi:hypothetical protein